MCWGCEVMHPGMALRAALSRAGPIPAPADAPARYVGAQPAGRWQLRASQLHGRRLSRPALDRPGPGRRERSDRRTRRVGAVSTCVTMSKHDGIDIPSPHARPPLSVCLAGVRAGAMMGTRRLEPTVHGRTHSHHARSGCVRKRCSATSRIRARSCTLAGPRGSSDRCTR